MKMTTLESVVESMEKRQYVIEVPEAIRLRAKRTLERMLEVGK
jgi:quinolinate synthase